jgi:CDP-6-deoxy-D-xylo-4-hexulose-3-dehydrase
VEIAEAWRAGFEGLRDRFVPMRITEGTEATWFGFPVLCRDRETRAGLKAHLERNGIETRPIICGNMARQPAMERIEHRVAGELRGADRVMDCGLYWGSHPLMTSEEVAYVAATVKGFFRT